jgi:hypothetical protein
LKLYAAIHQSTARSAAISSGAMAISSAWLLSVAVGSMTDTILYSPLSRLNALIHLLPCHTFTALTSLFNGSICNTATRVAVSNYEKRRVFGTLGRWFTRNFLALGNCPKNCSFARHSRRKRSGLVTPRFSFLNPVGLPKSLFPALGCQENYFRGLHSIGFITYCQCDRNRRLLYVGTVGQTPSGETALHSAY